MSGMPRVEPESVTCGNSVSLLIIRQFVLELALRRSSAVGRKAKSMMYMVAKGRIADVFVSYASPDAAVANAIVEALE